MHNNQNEVFTSHSQDLCKVKFDAHLPLNKLIGQRGAQFGFHVYFY